MTTVSTTTATKTVNPFKNVFHYASFCEQNFKRNIMERCGREITTTFSQDLSIAEWCQIFHKDENGVEDTITRSFNEWKNNEQYIIDLLFAVNSKALEHYALCMRDEYASMRCFTQEQHQKFGEYYSERYYTLLDAVVAHYEEKGDNETLSRIYEAID